MVSRPLRAVCAFAALVLFLGGIAGLVLVARSLYLIAIFAAAILAVPAMFGGPKPTERELPRIDEHLHRFRNAMFLCFAAAACVYSVVLTTRRTAAQALLQQLASLGVALWLVGFVLMFFVAYYRTRRRLVAERE
jgi:predicted cobalt transporter CbtA